MYEQSAQFLWQDDAGGVGDLDVQTSRPSFAAVWGLTASETLVLQRGLNVGKQWKARFSRTIQLSVIVLTALAGLFPIVAYLAKDMKWPYLAESGLWPSFFVGIAATLIGIDRAFGLSSSWSRYVLTATSIRKMLEEFRLDCALIMCT